MFNLTGKTVVVTGATGGIGLAISEVLHKSGATLIIVGTNDDKLDALKDKLGERVHSVKCNLTSESDLAGLISKSIELAGPIDGLVCNAGITKDNLSIRMSNSDFSDVIKVNLESTFSLNRDFLKHMIKNKKGRVINISSVVAFSGNAGQANYCASKAGMVGMSKSLAREVASRGVTVNCVAPGFIKTPMTEVLSEEQRTKISSSIPAGYLGEPNDIAYAVLYLLSDEARYINGQTLHINGGMLML